ncbi:MAG: hypothetical protein H6Q15_2389 [Bacteroidetes bacterium]|nr:hypothetical protein [Bacteroidota bacterium]
MMSNNISILYKAAFIYFILIVFNSTQINAQTGTNIDFSNGNYSFWVGYQGRNLSNQSNFNISSWTTFSNPATCYWQGSQCFVINSPTSAAFDNIIPTLKKVPTHWGYTHSSQINTNKTGANANKLSYDLDITSLNSLLTINYAAIMEAPGHSGYQNPIFKVEVKQLTGSTEGNLVNPCSMFEQTGKLPVPQGWNTFSILGVDGIWQDWRQVSFNLSEFENTKVRINIILAGCSPTGHWSYGYFTAKVAPAKISSPPCLKGDTIAILEAPVGFAKYEWISRPNDFNNPSNQFNIGPIISTSSANLPQPADNKLIITKSSPFANDNYFMVKLTAFNSTASSLGCETFIKTKKPINLAEVDFDTVLYCNLKVDFIDKSAIGFTDPLYDTLEYIWDFGDGYTAYYNSITAINPNRNPSHTYANPGNYTVKLIVKINGCDTSISKNILVHPSFNFTVNDTTICIGDQATIHASSSYYSNIEYDWRESPEDTAAIIYHGDTYSLSPSSDKTFWVTGYLPNSVCTKTIPVTITIQKFPDLNIIGDTIVCIGKSTILTAIDPNGIINEIEWSYVKPTNQLININTNPTINITPIADTTIYLIARAANGCITWREIKIKISDASIYANKEKVCPGDEVILTGKDAIKYSWTSNPYDPTLTNDTLVRPISVYPKETTIYSMKGYGTTGCSVERNIKIIVVPFPEAKITYSPDFIDMNSPILYLKDNSKYGVASKWDISDGTTSHERSFTHRFKNLSEKEYSIFLTTYNEIGAHCFDTASITLPIGLFSIWLPNSITPDGDGQNDKFFFFSINKLEEVKFEVYNRWGEKLYSFYRNEFSCYEGMEKELGWDGTYKSSNVHIGSYAWKLTYRRPMKSTIYEKSGTVNVIR